MKFILLNGPSCVGKSTVEDRILQKTDRFFHLSYDLLKWSFSQYASGKFTKEIIYLMGAMLKAIADHKFDIVCDSGIHKVYRDQLLDIARENNYEILEINLEADYEILLGRFEERVRYHSENPQKRISNTSPTRHRELFDNYNKEKNPNAITFRTDTESIEEIGDKILKLL